MDHFLFNRQKRTQKLSNTPRLNQQTQRRTSSPQALRSYLQSRSTGDDFNQLLRDDSLARAIESQGQLVNHLSYKQNRKIRQRVTSSLTCLI